MRDITHDILASDIFTFLELKLLVNLRIVHRAWWQAIKSTLGVESIEDDAQAMAAIAIAIRGKATLFFMQRRYFKRTVYLGQFTFPSDVSSFESRIKKLLEKVIFLELQRWDSGRARYRRQYALLDPVFRENCCDDTLHKDYCVHLFLSSMFTTTALLIVYLVLYTHSRKDLAKKLRYPSMIGLHCANDIRYCKGGFYDCAATAPCDTLLAGKNVSDGDFFFASSIFSPICQQPCFNQSLRQCQSDGYETVWRCHAINASLSLICASCDNISGSPYDLLPTFAIVVTCFTLFLYLFFASAYLRSEAERNHSSLTNVLCAFARAHAIFFHLLYFFFKYAARICFNLAGKLCGNLCEDLRENLCETDVPDAVTRCFKFSEAASCFFQSSSPNNNPLGSNREPSVEMV